MVLKAVLVKDSPALADHELLGRGGVLFYGSPLERVHSQRRVYVLNTWLRILHNAVPVCFPLPGNQVQLVLVLELQDACLEVLDVHLLGVDSALQVLSDVHGFVVQLLSLCRDHLLVSGHRRLVVLHLSPHPLSLRIVQSVNEVGRGGVGRNVLFHGSLAADVGRVLGLRMR